MIKFVFCLRRKPGMSRQEFQTYWRERHAALVREHAQTIGCKRYVQAHTLQSELNSELRATRGAPDEYDGVAELWFDEREFTNPTLDRERVQQASERLIEDEREFIDLSRSPLFWAKEHVVIEG